MEHKAKIQLHKPVYIYRKSKRSDTNKVHKPPTTIIRLTGYFGFDDSLKQYSVTIQPYTREQEKEKIKNDRVENVKLNRYFTTISKTAY